MVWKPCSYVGDADFTLRQYASGMLEKELDYRGSNVPMKSLILGVSARGTGCTQRRG